MDENGFNELADSKAFVSNLKIRTKLISITSLMLIPGGNTVYALDVGSGELNRMEGMASPVNMPVTVEGNTAFVGLDNGEVASIGAL
jgi:hypothetical protein